MKEKLELSKLRKNQIVTILRWTSHRDHSWVGEALKVVKVELPFVIVEDVKNEWLFTLDTRQLEFTKLSKSFLKIRYPKLFTKPQNEFPEIIECENGVEAR